jgi:uncharacterized phiE125 gp8 family phage protein
MSLKLITEPVSEPVTLAEVKLQCRIDGNDDDAMLTSLITSARQSCEHILNRSLMAQTWELVLDAFPNVDIILRNPPVQSITSIKYIDAVTANEVTLATNKYSLDKDSEPSWVNLAYGAEWPDTLPVANAVRVRYVAGYTAVPEAIKNWIKLAVKEMYDGCATGETVSLNNFMPSLLDRYRVWDM